MSLLHQDGWLACGVDVTANQMPMSTNPDLNGPLT